MPESKSGALPLGDTPMNCCMQWKQAAWNEFARCCGLVDRVQLPESGLCTLPFVFGVDKGIRTLDPRNHNPVL